jgi:hypothetical protein
MSEGKIDPNVVLYPVLENDERAENVPYLEAVGFTVAELFCP